MSTQSLAQPLTRQQIDHFHDRGYLIADPGLDHDFLDILVQNVHEHYDPAFRENPTFATRLPDIWRQVDEVHRLAVNPVILAMLEQLLERKPLPFQTLNFPTGTRQAAHSDTIHFNSIPAGYMVGVWVAMEDITPDNGPLIYYPGSHKLPEMTMQDFGLEPGYEQYREYEEAMRDYVETTGLTSELGIIRKGEILIWHANLIHGGAPQTDPTLSRHSQVTHYYFADCEYYTPMYSTPGERHMRTPLWIPSERPEGASFVEPASARLWQRLLRRLRG